MHMKNFLNLKIILIASVIFSILHWFIYPFLPAFYNNKYILDGIIIIVAASVAAYLQKRQKNKDDAGK